jgi:cytochrome P450
VRLHPTRVSINSATAFKTIYGARANVKKSKFYNVFSKDMNHENTLNTTDVKIHARKKRALNVLFSDKNVREAEAFVVKHVERWCELLLEGNDGKEWTEPRNISHLIDFLVFDIISELFFGKSFELKVCSLHFPQQTKSKVLCGAWSEADLWKEPGENPLKVIPEAIPQFIAFLYPVSYTIPLL